MKRILTVLALAGLLTACKGFPVGEGLDIGLQTAYTYYTAVYCTGNPCSASDKATAKKAYNLAEQGVTDFTDGEITQQEAQTLIDKALALLAKLET